MALYFFLVPVYNKSMDTDQLISHARARFDHEAARRALREKYQAKMIFAHEGGMWRAGPELICTLECCPDETSIIEDLYGTPVKINVPDMIFLVQQRWQEQMSAWLIEHEELRSRR